MKKTYKSALIAVLVGLLISPQLIFAAASGNYTDLLPIGAAGNTTVISNGSGWSLTTLPPTQTFGDALSRVVTTVFQSTATATINATTTVSTFTAVTTGKVGSTTFPASWIATGRSIRTTVEGTYSVPNAGSNWTFTLKLGTTTVLATTAAAATANQANKFFKAIGLMTVAATGNAGTVNASYEIYADSGSVPNTVLSYSTNTAAAVTVDLTSQLTVNPTLTWGTANSSVTVNNVLVEFLN